jgi:hypothetical protein
LAKDLKAFGVKPGFNSAKTVRGFKFGAFRDAFRRYLRPDPSDRPKQSVDQCEDPESQEPPTRPEPVRHPSVGRLTDVRSENEESPKAAVQSDISDVWTTSDATPVGAGEQG